ncbi:MAG: hypothetical protein D6731_06405 [Planctomycetota bacterium]|nr:MAG: hypothetical protein D6731_06405 [Planctomycetota bacterium]
MWEFGSRHPRYSGGEGELYDLREDPFARVNLWEDPSRREERDALLEELWAHPPPIRQPPLPVATPTEAPDASGSSAWRVALAPGTSRLGE